MIDGNDEDDNDHDHDHYMMVMMMMMTTTTMMMMMIMMTRKVWCDNCLREYCIFKSQEPIQVQ